jgi:hypothetical protein
MQDQIGSPAIVLPREILQDLGQFGANAFV